MAPSAEPRNFIRSPCSDFDSGGVGRRSCEQSASKVSGVSPTERARSDHSLLRRAGSALDLAGRVPRAATVASAGMPRHLSSASAFSISARRDENSLICSSGDAVDFEGLAVAAGGEPDSEALRVLAAQFGCR